MICKRKLNQHQNTCKKWWIWSWKSGKSPDLSLVGGICKRIMEFQRLFSVMRVTKWRFKIDLQFLILKISHQGLETHPLTRFPVSRALSGVIDEYRLQLTGLQGFVRVLRKWRKCLALWGRGWEWEIFEPYIKVLF